MTRLHLFAQACHYLYISKCACGGARERSLPWRESGEREGVSVRHGGCYENMMRTTRQERRHLVKGSCRKTQLSRHNQSSTKVAFSLTDRAWKEIYLGELGRPAVRGEQGFSITRVCRMPNISRILAAKLYFKGLQAETSPYSLTGLALVMSPLMFLSIHTFSKKPENYRHRVASLTSIFVLLHIKTS